jgi:hypothetical protein
VEHRVGVLDRWAAFDPADLRLCHSQPRAELSLRDTGRAVRYPVVRMQTVRPRDLPDVLCGKGIPHLGR